MRYYDYEILDVFTTTAYAGNPLAIVYGADSLSAEQMQKIAKEFNLSETVFVCEPTSQGCAASIYSFTPAQEIEFAGHAVLGCSLALAQKHYGKVSEAKGASFALGTRSGAMHCHVTVAPQHMYAEIVSPALPQEHSLQIVPEEAAGLVNLAYHQVGFQNHDISAFSAGLTAIMIPVYGLADCARATPQVQLGYADAPYKIAYVYTKQTANPEADYHVRMFAPSLGITEDAATGALASAFAGVIMKYNALMDGEHNFIIEQGVEMGRPSLIYLRFMVQQQQLVQLRIGGYGIKTAEGRLIV